MPTLPRERAATATRLHLLPPVSRAAALARTAVLLAVVVLGCAALDRRGFAGLEQRVYELRLALYARRHGSLAEWARRRIIIVERNDDGFERWHGRPLPRAYHAQLIRRLTQAGAAVIAFDFAFNRPRPGDDELAAAAAASGRVLWACHVPGAGDLPNPPPLLMPTARLWRSCPRAGHINVPPEPLVSHLQAVEWTESRPVPALSIVAAALSLGAGNQMPRHDAGVWHLGPLRIPVDASGRFLINYLGTQPRQVFQYVPYDQMYAGAGTAQQELFKNKIVLVGDTSALSDDVRLTPLGRSPGVEIHAHAIATLLLNALARPVAPALDFAILLLAAGLGCALGASCGPRRAVVLAAMALAGLVALNGWLFVEHRVWLHLVAPSVAIWLATGGALALQGWVEHRDHSRLLALLSGRVGPPLIQAMLEHPERCLHRGDRAPATVLAYTSYTPRSAQSSALPWSGPVQATVTPAALVQAMVAQAAAWRVVATTTAESAIVAPEAAPGLRDGARLDGAGNGAASDVSSSGPLSSNTAVTSAGDAAGPAGPSLAPSGQAALDEVLAGIFLRHEGALPDSTGGRGAGAPFALFGAPVTTADHARHAVAAALEAQSELFRLQDRWRDQGLPILDIGIAVHSGELMSGLDVAEGKLSFPAAGVAIDLARQALRLNQTLKTRILLTSASYDLVKDMVRVRGPLPARLPDSGLDVVVYELLGWRDTTKRTSRG